ncbi:MAG: TonB-dependent siderophore receptor [Panacagrimonas sp.]
MDKDASPGNRTSLRRLGVAAALLLLSFASRAHAQAVALAIPEQNLESALLELARTAGVQLLFPADLARGVPARALLGDFTPEAALARLLEGTGLSFRYTADNTITIERVHVEEGLRTLGAVRVGGTQRVAARGANGSTDVYATENSGTYAARGAALGAPTPQELKDIPRTISVIGQTQIRDQGLIEVVEAMRLFPGVASVDLSGHEAVPVVRGHGVFKYQYDGGAVVGDDFGIVRVQGDLSAYDRVELLRGGDGLGHGYTSPGGLFNFVRKRPLDHPQLIVQTQAGSWDTYRGMVDGSTPLGWDGRLRGRMVVFGTDQQSFRDRQELQRQAYYGVVEADLGASTLLAIGTQYARQEGTPFGTISLPTFTSGAQIGLPRSTTFLLPWHSADDWRRNTFATLDQALGENWNARLSLGLENNDQLARASFVGGRVDPQTGEGARLASLILGYQRWNTTADAKLHGRFMLGGLEQQLSFSFTALRVRGHDYAELAEPFLYDLNVFNFDPADYPQPAFPPDPIPDRDFFLRFYDGNVALTLNPWAPLKLTGAWRWNVLEVPDFHEADRHYDAPSYLGLSYAAHPLWNVYASWADVYEHQDQRNGNGRRLDPIVGSNYETGLKYASADGGVSGLLAIYRIEQRDFARQVSGEPFEPCCYDNGSNERRVSEGFDAELSGALLPRWQLTGSYNYIRSELRGSDSGDPGGPFEGDTPTHQFKLWTVWQPSHDALRQLRLGGGLRARTRSSLRRIAISETQSVLRSQGGYAVADALVGWRFDSQWDAVLNVRNLFDRVYYANYDPNQNSANIYGEPRSLMLTLRGTW